MIIQHTMIIRDMFILSSPFLLNLSLRRNDFPIKTQKETARAPVGYSRVMSLYKII